MDPYEHQFGYGDKIDPHVAAARGWFLSAPQSVLGIKVVSVVSRHEGRQPVVDVLPCVNMN